MRLWRNRQTRTFEGRVGNRTGSSPVSRTKADHAAGISGGMILRKIGFRFPKQHSKKLLKKFKKGIDKGRWKWYSNKAVAKDSEIEP